MPITSIRSVSATIAGCIGAFIAGSAIPAPAAMRDVVVRDTPQLVTVLRQSRGGKRVLLAPGEYAPFALRGIAPPAELVITSQDPSRRAVLTGVNLRDGANLTFRNLVLRGSGKAVQEDFLFRRMRKLTISNILASGRPGAVGLAEDKIMQLRECTDAAITRAEFTNAVIALSLLDTKGVSVTSSYFHGLRMDAIRGGGNSDVLIGYNYITGFSPKAGDHPDGIQFWTSRQKAAAHDIRIVGNVIHRGRGKAMQGIFMRDETSNLPYRNVYIQDNLVAGGMFNGIAVLSQTKSLTLKNNVVAAYPDQKSWIRVNDYATLRDNSAPIYLIGNNRAKVVANNHITPVRADAGAAALKAWARGRPLHRYSESLRRHVDSL
ncbi:right-handed parallel beta-helix repeat-containing protein [Sphingomonas sp. IC4-52]|uniref:right-handed parallel beta-helix repeat-containing protein n=1 Tax=Sphingomonas sp. IC4-52 TaxID=2887202 RepID=UPI001D12AA86|nr:right-handed parallel beta-helix repeat-containing protein [Sphingomonas sp. IC4-52]MCC2978529.1 right-handed parallel beta-helix repeat-containing protein [Sphingomonas sp. IC4-52]